MKFLAFVESQQLDKLNREIYSYSLIIIFKPDHFYVEVHTKQIY